MLSKQLSLDLCLECRLTLFLAQRFLRRCTVPNEEGHGDQEEVTQHSASSSDNSRTPRTLRFPVVTSSASWSMPTLAQIAACVGNKAANSLLARAKINPIDTPHKLST